MGWSIGYDFDWSRDVGYGVPAVCDYPECNIRIDRGLSYVCAEQEMYGGENGCGLYFCSKHSDISGFCIRCREGKKPFEPKPELKKWLKWKLYHKSWAWWRHENPDGVKEIVRRLKNHEFAS